jgi:hypothetical protein
VQCREESEIDKNNKILLGYRNCDLGSTRREDGED